MTEEKEGLIPTQTREEKTPWLRRPLSQEEQRHLLQEIREKSPSYRAEQLKIYLSDIGKISPLTAEAQENY